MKRLLRNIFAVCMIAVVTAAAVAGPSVEIRLRDGSKWRGEVSDQVEMTILERNIEVKFAGELVKAADLYLIVEGDIAGEIRQKTIFRDDIIKMKTVDPNAPADASSSTSSRPKRSTRTKEVKEAPKDASGNAIGVFVLPLEGTVGSRFRKEEIIKIGEKADEYGPGQVIVLLINSNGGSALESQYIADEIWKIRQRHRVVAWIKKAISAGCQTAMCCQEIYFMTEGSAGAVTTWDGQGNSITGEDLKRSMEHLAKIAERSGYSKYIAHAMKTNKSICTYDKDPETGQVTFYGDMTGEHVLSDGDSNLSFTSSVAEDCGFSKGTADTTEELAELLDLPRWHEMSDYGRKIAKSWQDTCDQAEEDIPRIIARKGYKNSTLDAIARLGTLIQLNNRLIRWWDRAPNVCQMMIPPKEYFERENVQLKKQLADLKRAQRGR